MGVIRPSLFAVLLNLPSRPVALNFHLLCGQRADLAVVVPDVYLQGRCECFQVLPGLLAVYWVFLVAGGGIGIDLEEFIAHSRGGLKGHGPLIRGHRALESALGGNDLILHTLGRWAVAVNGLTPFIDPAIVG